MKINFSDIIDICNHRILLDRVAWYNKHAEYHREDGPAVIFVNGDQFWFINGNSHREDGPAIVRIDGRREWYINGARHKEDGPAIVHSDGSREWYKNGRLCRRRYAK